MLNWLFTDNYGGYTSGPLTNRWSTPQPVATPPKDYSPERLHSLELACAALWELLKQKNGYTDVELKQIIQHLGGQGQPHQATGLGDPNLNVCPKCNHKLLTQNHTKCLWCGADIAQQPFGS